MARNPKPLRHRFRRYRRLWMLLRGTSLFPDPDPAESIRDILELMSHSKDLQTGPLTPGQIAVYKSGGLDPSIRRKGR